MFNHEQYLDTSTHLADNPSAPAKSPYSTLTFDIDYSQMYGKNQQYNQNYTPATNKVSLSLSDLDVSRNIAGQNPQDNEIASPNSKILEQFGFIGTLDQMNYRKELAKLLVKSKGTVYEKTLRKFVENKLQEIARDEEMKQNDVILRSSPNKVPLTALSVSKYDSPQRNHYTDHQANIESVGRRRIDAIAAPLERNKYKVSEVLSVIYICQ